MSQVRRVIVEMLTYTMTVAVILALTENPSPCMAGDDDHLSSIEGGRIDESLSAEQTNRNPQWGISSEEEGASVRNPVPNALPPADAGSGTLSSSILSLSDSSEGYTTSKRAVGSAACPPGRLWGSSEVLLWWVQGQHLPALVSSSPIGTPYNQAGVLGQPGTSILFGNNSSTGSSMVPGGRFQIGYWFDQAQSIGFQSSFFYLSNNTDSFSVGPNSGLIIARPFFDVSPYGPGNNSLIVDGQGLIGHVAITSQTQVLGANALLQKNLYAHSIGNANDGLGASDFLRDLILTCRNSIAADSIC